VLSEESLEHTLARLMPLKSACMSVCHRGIGRLHVSSMQLGVLPHRIHRGAARRIPCHLLGSQVVVEVIGVSQMSFSKDRAGSSMLIDNFVTLCGSRPRRFAPFPSPGRPLTGSVRGITASRVCIVALLSYMTLGVVFYSMVPPPVRTMILPCYEPWFGPSSGELSLGAASHRWNTGRSWTASTFV
jgi:hypothetical protein